MLISIPLCGCRSVSQGSEIQVRNQARIRPAVSSASRARMSCPRRLGGSGFSFLWSVSGEPNLTGLQVNLVPLQFLEFSCAVAHVVSDDKHGFKVVRKSVKQSGILGVFNEPFA